MADEETKTAEEEVEEVEDEETSEGQGQGDKPDSTKIAAQLMKNPQVLAALQEKLGSIVGSSSGYIQSLPKPVKRRIKAMKKIQNNIIQIESDFYKDVHALEVKYSAKYGPLFEKRREVLTGKTEPTDEECDWPSDDEKDEEDKLAVSDDLKKKAAIEDKQEDEEKTAEDVKGIPGFWLTAFKNVDMLADMVQEHDEPILNHLQDIKVVFSDKEPTGFRLEFLFEANEFFTETVLTKEYTMRFEQDTSDPFSYEGPELVKCKGCTISWNKGKNVTVKTVKKKQKHKGRGTTRTVTKTVQNDSFFNFFNPPQVPDGEEDELDEDVEALLATDFEIGHFIRERLVPRAVLYFTGEAIENEDDYDEDDGEEEDEEGEYDEENDPDFQPAEGGKPAECKQQ